MDLRAAEAMRPWRDLALMLPLAAASAVAFAQDGDADAAAAAGRRLYTMSCQRCHGLNLATNGIGFDLRKFPEHDKERFLRSVTNGLRAMPAWGGTLKPEQMELIWAYIGSVNGWPSASTASSAPTPAPPPAPAAPAPTPATSQSQ
jgi:mono/diheme cytochrome c family protein